jgi:hypothetical protein
MPSWCAFGSSWGKKAPALTLQQVLLILSAALPLPERKPEVVIDRLVYTQQRNHAAYVSHRKRRVSASKRPRGDPSL